MFHTIIVEFYNPHTDVNFMRVIHMPNSIIENAVERAIKMMLEVDEKGCVVDHCRIENAMEDVVWEALRETA